jgi:ABC-type uncharacterized transport system substrate-binding protein
MKVNHKVIEKIPYSKIAANANQITYNRSMKELKIMKKDKTVLMHIFLHTTS